METKQKMSKAEAGRLGYLKTGHIHKARYEARKESYNKGPKLCKNCNKVLIFEKRHNDYCNQSCAGLFRGKNTNASSSKTCRHCKNKYKSYISTSTYCSAACHKAYQFDEIIRQWKNGEQKGWTGNTCLVAGWLRKYLFIKYDNKCCKCGWNHTNPVTGKIPLEINHINGDASNCEEDNLELICPNCHSLTPNFRALNKNSIRKRGPAVGLEPTKEINPYPITKRGR